MVKKTQSKLDTVKKVLISLGIGAIISTVVWLMVDRYTVHEMICQVVGVDQENGVVGVRCLTR